MPLNATFGNILTMGPRSVGLRVLNFFHVRICTHVNGIRDPEHPCHLFELGTPDGHCLSDGHYVCKECVHFDAEEPL